MSTTRANSNQAAEVIQADWAYIDGTWRRDRRIAIDAPGRILSVESAAAPARRLSRRALLPGFVNAHSHAFQRGLRGRGEVFPPQRGDFWSWREAMYELVLTLDLPRFERVCRLAFEEMLAAGITTVGEFHYVHHVDAARRDFAFDAALLRAARSAGIRLVLLESYYKTGGVGQPLAGGQTRFATESVAAFSAQLDHLASQLDPRTQSLGVAPHSLRAVPPEDLLALTELAGRRGLVCHLHVEEQQREIEEVRTALGQTPMAWLLTHVPVSPCLTIVHATQTPQDRLEEYLARGGNVCACPLTEGNLGDGISLLGDMSAAPHAVCIGTDSNVRLDPAEELRWLEFAQRLRRQKRGVYVDPAGRVGDALLACGTRNGARALGIDAGRIAPGAWADFITLDLDHPSLTGSTSEMWLDAYLLGAGREVVAEVCVGGRWRSTAALLRRGSRAGE